MEEEVMYVSDEEFALLQEQIANQPDMTGIIDLSNADDVKEAIMNDLENQPPDTSFDEFMQNLFSPKVQVRLKPLVEEGFSLPWKATQDAAGFDVRAVSMESDANDLRTLTVHLGFATEIPQGYKGVIVPRSSFTKTNWIMQNSPAQIDSDYRGEWIIKFKELVPNSTIPINEGDRVAQIFFEKIIPVQFIVTDNLKETNRNDGGFGSTGL